MRTLPHPLLSLVVIAAASLSPLLVLPQRVRATTPAYPVISEVAWAASADSTGDEWIELANPTASPIDLTGWSIVDDAGASTYALLGSIAANGFFLIEKREIATSVTADLIITGISLANDGDRLELRNATGVTVDDVNPTGAAWPAGDNTTHATMERTGVSAPPGDAGSWGSSTGSGPATASLGSPVQGTPRAVNSLAGTPQPTGLHITLQAPGGNVAPGGTATLTLKASGAADLLSYGLDITYPPASVASISATEGSFLAGSPVMQTAFQSGLLDGQAGRLRLAGSRLSTPPTGATGDGTLATISLVLAPAASGSVVLAFAPGAFAASPGGDITTTFTGATVTVGSTTTPPVTDLTLTQGTARYSLHLSWTAPAGGADSYIIRRRDLTGSAVDIGTSTTESFTDDDSVALGGAIIPTRSYHYEVIAVRGAISSTPVTADGSDTRGILGDSTRDDTTDGRDLTLLARSWGLVSGETGFNRLVDTSIDGAIDGDDLVDLATHWAISYTAP